ncbi:hypothetical protein GQ464_008815 [Rhodocaloribacter litoris]|uniref:anti-sigma factor family protein n=1 Tax=Rhodocaloribacter litoris TaxID=2558931 RepID=UPI00141E2E9A|nr:hypothetical protein [Rhodocaloribacter litoris]QXD17017.1 hypothetical protein GQ464_008815 [Rhodocaloribacter litoris]
MSEGYDAGKEDASYSWLDEFLCEYVDGTMDPGVRAAFEEYLRANPVLLEHVQRLRRTRQLLCRYGACHAPRGFQARLQRRLACELMATQHPLWPGIVSRLGTYATWASVMIVVFIVGMLAGTTFLREPPGRSGSSVTSRPDAPLPSALPSTMQPLWWTRTTPIELALSGPATPLPASSHQDHPAGLSAHQPDTVWSIASPSPASASPEPPSPDHDRAFSKHD